jgi:hypothetical protein
MGDVNSIKDRAIYKLYRVKTIVQCGKELSDLCDNKELKIYNYPIVDNDKYNIAQHFDEIYSLIH